MSELLKQNLDDLIAAKKAGDKEKMERLWEERRILRGEQRERAFGHPEDIPPSIQEQP